MTERSELAPLGAIVAALAIVALGRSELPQRTGPALPRAPAARAQAAPAALAALRDGRRIELNCADAATLELLPGVGPQLAQRIVEDRRSRGAFASLDQLDRVPGVGPKTLARVRPLLEVGAGVSCRTSTTARP